MVHQHLTIVEGAAVNSSELVEQFEEAIALCNRALSGHQNDRYSASSSALISEAATTAITLAELVSGRGSVYYTQISKEIEKNGVAGWLHLAPIIGVLQVLKKAVSQGLLDTIKGEIQGELFSDFLERAGWLLTEGHKDAAAVVAGSVLEEHLRQLCLKNSIELAHELNGDFKPKKTDRLNAALTRAEVYSKLDQKNVTAWLDLRNKAAHGLYEEYEKAQVGLVISGIRDFINRVKV